MLLPKLWRCVDNWLAFTLGLAGFGLLLVAHPARADTLWMKNGDRLTGTIKLLDGGKLTIYTKYGGDIRVDWDQVATVQSDQKLLLKKEGEYRGTEIHHLDKSEQGQVVVDGVRGKKKLALAKVSQLIKPRTLLPKDFLWKGSVDANFKVEHVESDSDTHNYDVIANSEFRYGRWRHTSNAEYHRETVDDTETTGNWKVAEAPDYFITERWFWQGRFDYQRDKMEEISRQWILGTGPGYQFWDNELGAFRLTGLFNEQRYQYDDGTESSFNTLAVKWNYTRLLFSQSIELFTDGEVGRPTAGEFDYFFNGELGLRYKLNNWMSLNLRTERERVQGNVRGELDKTRYFLGMGVFW